jgi:hypothetical protein
MKRFDAVFIDQKHLSKAKSIGRFKRGYKTGQNVEFRIPDNIIYAVRSSSR